MRASSRSVLSVRGVDFASRTTRNCIPDEVIRHHVRLCLARDLPELKSTEPHDRVMVIAGSGPSLTDIEPEGDIFALGGAHDWLIDRGIVPHGHINADPLPLVADYIKTPHPQVTYYLASHSHPFVFEGVDNVVVWHDEVNAGTDEVVREHGSPGEHIMVTGGSTGATRAPFLGHELGYRKFVYYGVDGSGGRAARGLRNKPSLTVECGGRTFETPANLIHQAMELEAIIANFPEWDIEVRGSELMAAVAREVRG